MHQEVSRAWNKQLFYIENAIDDSCETQRESFIIKNVFKGNLEKAYIRTTFNVAKAVVVDIPNQEELNCARAKNSFGS